MSEIDIVVLYENTKQNLLSLAKKNNNKIYIDKIFDALSEFEIEDIQIDDCREFLENNGITVIEDEEIDEIKYQMGEVKVNDSIKLYLKEACTYPLLTAKEEVELAKRYKEEGDESAREILANSNLRLCVSYAKHYQNRGLNFLDLVSEANMGLLRAIDKFDYNMGYKFSTYASWWIKQNLQRACMDKSRLIRIPTHVAEVISKMNRLSREFEQEEGREPTAHELALLMGEDMTEDRILFLQQSITPCSSLDSFVGDDQDTVAGDFIADTSELAPNEYMSEQMDKELMMKAISNLREREQLVLINRYGLGNCREHSLEEIGQMLNVSRERVRQIESVAKHKLKKALKSSF